MGADARLAAVLARWTEQGFGRGPEVTPAEVDAWEARHGRTLPPEVREYFLTLNGFVPAREGIGDLDAVCFWPLAELKPVAEEIPEARGRHASSYFAFAHNELWTTVYALHLRRGRNRTARVVVVSERWHQAVAGSLGEFLDGYLASDPDVLSPIPSASRAERIRRWLVRRFVPGGETPPRLRNRGTINRQLARFVNRLARDHPHLRRHRRGAIRLRFRVNVRGRAEAVEVVDPGPIPAFTEEAVRLAARMRFSPARVNRVRVPVLVELPMTFQFPG